MNEARTTDNLLVVRTITQAALFECELKGQLSDGTWENTRPDTHWYAWCDCRVVVADEGGQVGRTFHAVRDAYNFARKDLLEVVGTRMLNYARLARVFGVRLAKRYEAFFDLDGNFTGMPTYTGQYWDDVRAQLAGVDVEAVKAAVADETYSRSDMVRELKDLSKIIKVRL